MGRSEFLHFEPSPQVISHLSRQSFKSSEITFQSVFLCSFVEMHQILLSPCYPNRLLQTATQARTETADFWKETHRRDPSEQGQSMPIEPLAHLFRECFLTRKKAQEKDWKNRITMEAVLKRGIPDSKARANCYPLSPTSLLSVVKAGTWLLSPSVCAQFREPIVW